MLQVYADRGQTVKRGQLLLEMDPSVVNVNVAAAEANLARAIRNVKGEFAHVGLGDDHCTGAFTGIAGGAPSGVN